MEQKQGFPRNNEYAKYFTSPVEPMTLRDWFAGQALAGAAGNPNSDLESEEEAAKWCYKMADAMLKAREGK